MSIIPTYNIILLGKTGVGKSTFVNSIANYSTYDSLEEAIEVNEPQGVIPVSFEITLKNFKKIKITQLGCNRRDVENENLNTQSSSCTQEPRVYSFYNENVGFNVIDIPGMGDTAGPTQDARNIQIIMDKLSQFTVIHGIFIMLKAFEPRLTADVKYNLNATLMMLHANAIPNIMFIITTSRGADYNPGETMTTLEDYVANLEASNGIKIELSENTVICMDNEAYKFQCGWNKSDEYRKEFGPLIKNYSKSWDISSAAFFKLFERMYTMQGHHVQLSCAIGHARTIIHCLIGPLAAITALIQQALSPASREANIKALTKNGQQIKDEIEVQDTSSRTVCTSKKCIEIIRIPGTKKYTFNFKTVCHDKCFLRNVAFARFPEPALIDCQIFENGFCKHCKCSIERHMHIKHKQSQKQKMETVAEQPLTEEAAEKFMNLFVQAQQKEQAEIIKTIVMLSAYLKQNAILEYNNAFKERMELEIRKEQAALDAGNNNATEVIKQLEKTLTLYKNEMKVIDVSIKNGTDRNVSEENVNSVMSLLFNLKYNGKNIKKLYDAEYLQCQQSPQINGVNARELFQYKSKNLPEMPQ